MEGNGDMSKNDHLALEIALALSRKVPVYLHPKLKEPAPERPGQVGWLEVNGSGFVKLIFWPGYRWVEYYKEWPSLLEVEPRISFNA